MIELNGFVIQPTIFNDNTSQVWKLEESILNNHFSVIKWDFEHEGEFMHLAQLVMLLRSIDEYKTITLHMPFLPYGRQDKEVSNTTTFALGTFGSLLETLAFDEVTTLDAHSNEIEFWDIKNIEPSEEINYAITESNCDLVCYPDFGALSRYSKMIRSDYVYCEKSRDQLTGYLTIKDVITKGKDIKNKNILIVDDICDGGMTFKLTAKKLYELGAKNVDLYTTHGIYSKGIPFIKASGIKRIFNRKGEIFASKNTNYLVQPMEI